MDIILKDIYLPLMAIILPVLGLVVHTYRHKILLALKVTLLAISLSGAVVGAVYYTTQPSVIERIVKVPFERSKEEAYKEAIETIPQKYGIPKIVMEVLIEKESGGNVTAVRFEPHVMARAKKITNNDGEQRMLSSSHGLCQLLGTTALEMGISWSDLYDPLTNIEAGSAYFAKKKEECANKHRSEYDKLKCAAKAYNGTGARAEQYSQDFMERLARKIVEERGI